MAWYRTGTITVTNGSTTVTGSGTQWIANAAVGEALYAPDGRLYEITNIASDTAFTIAPAYLGSTQSGQAYVIVPSQSYIRDLAAQAADLVNNYSTIANTTGVGKFVDGTVSAPGIRFSDDLDTGIYRIGSNNIGIAAGGTKILDITSTGLTYTGTLTGSTGVLNIGSGQIYKDASGNVGIGTTVPSFKLNIEGSAAAAYFNAAEFANTDGSGYLNTAWKVGSSVATVRYAPGVLFKIGPDSGDTTTPIIFATNNATERMRIDSSGNVGIGTSSPVTKLTVSTPSGNAQASFFNGTSDGYVGIDSSFSGLDIATGGGIRFRSGSGFAERARINSSGNWLFGTTSAYDGSAIIQVQMSGINTGITTNAGSTDTAYAMGFYNPNGLVGGIITAGSGVSYNTFSDYRLKENVVPLEGAIERLMKLPVHRFNFIADPETVVDGFLAHEAQEVVPQSVTGKKDEVDKDGKPVYQGVDYSKLVPLLSAALQEAIKRIEQLELQINSGV